MATALLDLNLEDLPSEIIVQNHYSNAFVLLRFKGRPVGKIIIPVFDGRLMVEENHNKIFDAASPALWTKWLHNFLNRDDRKANKFIPYKATVAICTRDRPEDLRRCIDALMKLPDDG